MVNQRLEMKDTGLDHLDYILYGAGAGGAGAGGWGAISVLTYSQACALWSGYLSTYL